MRLFVGTRGVFARIKSTIAFTMEISVCSPLPLSRKSYCCLLYTSHSFRVKAFSPNLCVPATVVCGAITEQVVICVVNDGFDGRFILFPELCPSAVLVYDFFLLDVLVA